MASKGVGAYNEAAAPNEGKLRSRHVAFLDVDALFFEVERFKAERGWYNLNLTREAITDLLDNPGWYRLEIPEEELLFDDAEKVDTWQEIAGSLLKKYVERYYLTSKKNWERPHLEYQVLSENDPNFLVREPDDEPGYRILLDTSDEDILAKLRELKNAIESGSLKALNFNGIRAINFDRHLYAPLLYLESSVIDVTPVALNTGERKFVEDLKRLYTDHTDFFEGRELYLLRNLSKGRGVGFFEAGNFHPDFILWLIDDKHQYVTYVDPKGLRNVGPTDPKVRFHETVKELEVRLGAASVTLNSFIISKTSFHALTSLWGEESKEEMAASHVIFQEDEGYVHQMLEMMTEGENG